ncbi:MAG: DUF481 domain-containing protein [Flavobacteriaceae bacterium]
MNHPFRYALILVILYGICIGSSDILGQNSTADSTITPFRKGRWLTGITGTISSSVNETKSTDERTSSNEYALNIVGGNFFRDRWLVGGIVQMTRSDADGLTDLNSESLFLGPLISRYFSDSDRGSLFLTLSPGYTRYNNTISFMDDLDENFEESEGSGFGFIVSLGYSYVILDRVSFDIGVSLSQSWLNVERRLEQDEVVFSDDINLRDISFSFGFRVLLDRFLQ